MHIENNLNLASISQANVSNPVANSNALFIDATTGRTSQKDSAGAVLNLDDTTVAQAFDVNLEWSYNTVVRFYPSVGTAANGSAIGINWTSTGNTVTHIQPTYASVATSLYKTRYASVATTASQQVGIIGNGNRFARSTAAGVGGFYFKARFSIESIVNAQTRLFVGLGSGAIVNSDNPAGNFVGLWHDTTDAITALSWMTKNGTTLTKNSPITIAGGLAAGQNYEVELSCASFGSTITCVLRDYITGSVLSNVGVTTTLPATNATLTPIVHISNALNAGAGDVAIGINFVICRSAS